MDIEQLKDLVIVEKQSMIIKAFSQNILEAFPNLEVGKKIIKYLKNIDYNLLTQRINVDNKAYYVTIIETESENTPYYLFDITEDLILTEEKEIVGYDCELIEDYLDEYDVYESYDDRVQMFSQSFIKLVNTASKVFIMGHRYPDLDSFSSSLGILWLSKFLTPNKECYIILDEVTSSISSLYEKVILEPEYKSCIIVGENYLKDIDIDKETLLIVVDVDNTDMISMPSVYGQVDDVVVIDHHRRSINTIDATLKLHIAYASATAELVTKLIQTYCRSEDMNSFLAEALLAGITIDTKNFAFQTTFETFETAAFLKKVGINSKRLRQLLQSKFVDYRTKAKIVNSVSIYNEDVAISVVSLKPNANPKLIIAMVADELLNLIGIEVAFVIAQVAGDVFISARSLGLNVARIMGNFGGGGHLTVAAAIVRDAIARDVKADILEMIKDTEIEDTKIDENRG